MQNPLHNIQRRRRIQTAAVSILGLVLLWLILPLLSQGIFFALSPFWKKEDLARKSILHSVEFVIESKNEILKDKRRLERDIHDLEKELQDLKIENARLSIFESILPKETPVESELALVYSKPPASPYDTFLINKGSDDGLKKGDSMYVNEGSVVGVVEKTFPDHSLVRLFSYPGMETVVILEDGVEVVAKGEGAYSFSVDISIDSGVGIGSLVRHASITQPILGVVGAIEEDEAEGFKTLFIRPIVNLSVQEFLIFYPNS